MRYFKRLSVVALCCLLTACEHQYFQSVQGPALPLSDKERAEMIVTRNGQDQYVHHNDALTPMPQDTMPVAAVETPPAIPPAEVMQQGRIPEDLASRMSGGAVEVYSLDDVPSYPYQPEPRMAPAFTAGDPSVTVYSLDDGYQPWQSSPMMAPASSLIEAAPVSNINDTAEGPAVAQIYFGDGQAGLDRQGRRRLEQIADNYKITPGTPIKVEGHASATGSGDEVERHIANLKVSADRAVKVSSELIRKGVPAGAIETSAWGDTKPGFIGPDMDPQESSRRVEIHAAVPAY